MTGFSEDRIREVMKHHRPGNEGYCLCAWSVSMSSSDQEFTVDHLIEELKRDDCAEGACDCEVEK